MVENQLLFYVQKWRWCMLLCMFLLFPAISHAAALTWDGGGADNNWSTCANWTTDTCPTSADTVTFNTTSTKDATIDASFAGTVAGMTISSGYTGIITQARTLTVSGNYSQAAGTFNGSTQAITLSGSFSLTAGSFKATSGTTTISSSFTVSGSSSFDANSGVVKFSGSGGSILSCNNITFNSVVISMQYADRTITIGSNCSIPGGNNPVWVGTIINNGTITLGTGTLNLNGTMTNNSTLSTSLTEMDFLEGSGGGSFTNAGTLTMGASPVIKINASLNLTGGTQPAGITLLIQGGSSGTLTCAGYTFSSISVNKQYADRGLTIASSCTHNFGNDPSWVGTITNQGNISFGTGTFTLNGNLTNTGTITSSLSEMVFTDPNFGGSFTNSGTLTMGASPVIRFYTSLNFTNGTQPSGITLYSEGSSNGTLTCGGYSFASVTINKTWSDRVLTIASSCTNNTVPLGNNPTSVGTITNNGVINVGTGTWSLNGDLTNSGTITTSLSELDVLVGNCCGGQFTNTGTLTMNANPAMVVQEGFLYNSGTIPDNITLTLSNDHAGSFYCGTESFASVTMNKVYFDRNITPTSNCTIVGDLTITGGSIPNPSSAYTWTVGGNIYNVNSYTTSVFGGTNLTLEMNGNANKTLTSNLAIVSPLKINKTAAVVTLASNATTSSSLTVQSGTFDQGASYNLIASSITIASGATFSNTGTGDLTLSGNVSNSGTVTLDGSGIGGGGADAIAIRSSVTGTQRTWSGTGTFSMFDVDVKDQTGSVTAYSSTDSGNNGWTILSNTINLDQKNYRWFSNADSITPGSALAALNAATAVSTSSAVRLRLNLEISLSSFTALASKFNFQYATSTSGTWFDVGRAWWNSSWRNRKKIIFDNSSSSTNLTDFPVLVVLDSSNIDYSKTQNLGQDLRFTDANGTALNYEIESWNESGTSYVWVKVPQIDATSTTDHIWMYYNNPSASDGQNASGVWDSNFKAVWHMNETMTDEASTGVVLDSTSDAISGNQRGNDDISGKIGNGQDFDGSNDYIDFGNSSYLPNSTNPRTMCVWARPNTVSSGFRWAFAYGSASTNAAMFIGLNGTTLYGGAFANDLTVNSFWATNVWHHVCLTYDGTNAQLYSDGASVSGPTAKPWSLVRSVTYAGRQVSGSEYWSGSVDEVRISNVARSADWIAAEYKTESNTMNTFGGEESADSTVTFYDNPSVSDGTSLSSTLLTGSTVAETYQESSPTPFNPSQASVSDLVEYDFSLDPVHLSSADTYYFRLTDSSSYSSLTYTRYPTLTLFTNSTPTAPPTLGPSSLADGSWSADNTPTFTFTLSDPDASDTVQYRIQIDDDANFASPVVDYTSGLSSQGSASFTVGQSPGAGAYAVGAQGQTLSDVSYYWRVKTIDNSSAESSYSTANSGSVAFQVDATAPTLGALSVSDPNTTSVTIFISTSSDSGSGISSYLFQNQTLATDSGVGTSTSWTDSGLSPGTTYTYMITVTDGVGNIATSTIQVTTDSAAISSVASNGPPDLIGRAHTGLGVDWINPNAHFFEKNMLGTTSVPSVPVISDLPEMRYIFKRALKVGQMGEDVRELQKYLNAHGFVIAESGPGSPGNETTKFGALTYKALIKFQEAHAEDILTPSGLKRGTGFFGASTRAFVNAY